MNETEPRKVWRIENPDGSLRGEIYFNKRHAEESLEMFQPRLAPS